MPSTQRDAASPRTRARSLHDHATWWLLAILATTLLGFTRTISTRLGVLDWLHLAHGVASLGWLMVLIAQAEFIRRGERSRHRALAVVGVICAMLLSVTALPMMQSTAAKALTTPSRAAISWFIVSMDVGLLIIYLGAFAVAVANIRQPAVHGRAMAATALVALPPGLGRWFMTLFHVNPVTGSYAALAVAIVWLIALIVSDRRAGVRDRVYPGMLAAIVLVTLASGPIATRLVD
jgi:hypothetical protein